MELKKPFLVAGLVAALMGCIDSGDDEASEEGGGAGGAERISFTGLVADGYLRGATVCIDENENKECDPSEPSTVSGEGGTFSFSDVVSDKPILMVVIEGETIDEDTITEENPDGTVFSKPLTLSAPAGYTNVTPLSTMVQNEVESGTSTADAEAAVKNKLGTTQNLDSDYIAAANDDTLSDEQKAEFLKMQQVAQVTARVISDNMESLEVAAEENSISLDDLISAIVDEVFDALDAISVTVDENTGDFDPDVAAQEVNQEEIGLNPDNIDDVVEQNKAEEAATTANLANVFTNGGVTWAWAEIYDGMLEADYGTASIDGNGDFQETVNIWNGSSAFVEDTQGGGADVEYILTESGWVEVEGGDTPSSAVAETDGTVTLNFGNPTKYSERLTGQEIDLEGLNIRNIMNSVDDGDGIFGDYIDPAATFTAGAKGYSLEDAGSDEPYLFEDWGDCEEVNKLNGFCSYAYVQNGPVDGKATTFADITSSSKYTLTGVGSTDVGAVLGVEIGYGESDKLWAEIVQDGTVNYYAVNHSHDGITLLGSSTWSGVSINPAAAIELVGIPEIQGFDSDFDDGGNPVIALVNGYIRNASHELAETAQGGVEVNLLNSAARDQMIAYFSLNNYVDPTELADKGCETGNYEWDAMSDPTGGTVLNESDFDTQVTTCTSGGPLVIPSRSNLVDTKLIAKNGAGEAVYTYYFDGYNATEDKDTGVFIGYGETYSFRWELEAGPQPDEELTGSIRIIYDDNSEEEMVWLSVNSTTNLISVKARTYNVPGVPNGTGTTSAIWSGGLTHEIERARSTLSDLEALGVIDDSTDDGTEDVYLDFVDSGNNVGILKLYERKDAAIDPNCFILTDIPLTDEGSGAFTADLSVFGEGDGTINVGWYAGSDGNLYEDQWRMEPHINQSILTGLTMCQ